MSDETIVAIFDTAAHADAAVQDLVAAHVPQNAISTHANIASTGTPAMPAAKPGFWASIFGGEPDHNTDVYSQSVQGGSTVVTVKAPDEHIAAVMSILERHNPIDIDERASSYGLTQSATTQVPVAPAVDSTAADGGAIQLSEEQLVVGKRLVNRGGTRVRRFVVEVPVEEQVTLHDEKVTLERRPVTDGRPVTDSFSDKAIEMTATGEEAVVGKTARVVEEVGLRKEAIDHVETIRDTVRKEDVKVEQVPGATTTTTTTGTIDPRAPKI